MTLRSLYAKLAGVLLGLLLLVGIALVFITVYSTDMYQQEVNQKLNRTLAELIVSEKIVMRDNLVNEEALKDIFHMLMVINPSIEVYLLDPQGNILAFSADPGKVKRSRIDLGPVRKFLKGSESFPILGDDPRSPIEKKVFTAARVPREGPLEGYLYVILGGEIYDSVLQKLQGSYIFRISIWTTALILFVAAVAGLTIFACLTQRLRRLSLAMRAYSQGSSLSTLDLPVLARGKSIDELDVLTVTFREMAERIEKQLDSLKQADTLRRELVANVSHDLRTPLATLRGYLETLQMREEKMAPEERKKYLEVAMGHCIRLNNLVANLFELATLEAADIMVHKEPFSLGELVQDVVQKFSLAANEKKVDIRTNVGEDIPFVHADIGLIERVLENLIDNAMRYTPEHGRIGIVLTPRDETVEVRVSDTGPGIPEQEIPRIFNRFYRVDEARRDHSKHAGLGLAIAKKILDLHNSSIQVESVVNKGTTFAFILPVNLQ